MLKLSGKEPINVEGDITDREKVRSIFDQHPEISSVVHFAALKAVGESTEFPLQYYRNNVTGSIILMEEMLQAGVKNLVFSSSCTVYGEPKKVPISEDFSTGDVSSPYGRTKLMEGIIEDYAKSDAEFSCGVLRYFNPVGAHPSGEIGEDPNGIPDNLVPLCLSGGDWEVEKAKGFWK